MSFSYLIIDNNIENTKKTQLLFENFPDYTCVGAISDSSSVAEHIYDRKPQLVLMSLNDIDESMDKVFSMILELHQYSSSVPYFIAISNTDKYALKCIQSGFSDYVVNPLQLHQLGKSLFRFEKKNPIDVLKTICIKSFSDHHFVHLKDIVYLQADNTSTDLILTNGKKINAFKILKYFENTLPFYFLRIHKSYMVNINHVNRIYMSKLNCYLNNGDVVSFSNSYKDNIEEIIRRMGR